jgi:hypothetical protein
MGYDDLERENHQIFDVRFKATNAEANDVWILLNCTKEWREYDYLDSLLRYGRFDLTNDNTRVEMVKVAKRHTELRSNLSQQVRDIARAKGIEA